MAENVAWLRREVADFAERADMRPAQVADVRLALSEAVANVVHHAYEGRSSGLVVVEADLEDESLVVAVEDAGVGLRPRLRGEHARYGMALIAAVCEVSITTPADDGVRVKMRFPLEE